VDQPAFLTAWRGEVGDFDEQFLELIELFAAKAIDRAKVGTVAGGKHRKGAVCVGLAGDLAGAKHARRAGMDEQFEHHRWMGGPVALVAFMQRTQAELIQPCVPAPNSS